MALAQENPVVAEFFGAFGALVNFVDVLDTAVKAMQAELHFRQ
jgi:hypothetical protein